MARLALETTTQNGIDCAQRIASRSRLRPYQSARLSRYDVSPECEGGHEAARIHCGSWRCGSRLAARCGCAAAGVARDRVFRPLVPEGFDPYVSGVQARTERERPCRGKARDDRIPLGARRTQSAADAGGRFDPTQGGCDRYCARRLRGTCRRRGTRTVPIVFVIGADPVKVWSCRQSQSTRRERYWREFLGQ